MAEEQMKISILGVIAEFTDETSEAPWTVEADPALEDEINALFNWSMSSPGQPHIVELAATHYKATILVGPEPYLEGEIY